LQGGRLTKRHRCFEDEHGATLHDLPRCTTARARHARAAALSARRDKLPLAFAVPESTRRDVLFTRLE
jgi:hypothetical protein